MADLKNIHNIYFIGIGGIGMSALARYFRFQGKRVSGYDKTETDAYKNTGVGRNIRLHTTTIRHAIPKDVQLVVFTRRQFQKITRR